MPFEQVPDLVATRRVLLRGGWAFVSRHEVASLVVGHFRRAPLSALVPVHGAPSCSPTLGHERGHSHGARLHPVA